MKKRYVGIMALFLVSNALYPRRISMKIKSSAFEHGALIPKKYTCEGANNSPPLSFYHVPKNTKSLVVIMENRSPAEVNVTGSWVDWLIFNLPPTVKQLAPAVDIKSLGGIEGRNTWYDKRYSGPCPAGQVGNYYFVLYALDAMLNLNSDATKEKVLEAMKGHVITTAQLIGIYELE